MSKFCRTSLESAAGTLLILQWLVLTYEAEVGRLMYNQSRWPRWPGWLSAGGSWLSAIAGRRGAHYSHCAVRRGKARG